MLEGDTTKPEFAALTSDVRKGVKDIRFNLNDLAQTIDIVQKNRARFPSIDDAELASREAFVRDTKAHMQKVQETLQSERTKAKLAADKERREATMTGAEREQKRSAEEAVEARRQAQAQVERDQDAVLGDMSETLKRLGAIAGDIDQELGAQDLIIAEVTDEVDAANDNVDRINRKIEKLLGTSDKGKLCCMFILFILAIILFALIIYS